LPDLPANPAEFDESSTGEIAFVGQTSAAPPELWMRDAEGQAKQVTNLNEPFKRYGPDRPEFYKYKSFDGVEIEAALLKPAATMASPNFLPSFWCTAGPTGNWRDAVDAWGQLLVARGYACSVSERARLGRLRREIRGDEPRRIGRRRFQRRHCRRRGPGPPKGIANPARSALADGLNGGYMAEWA